jgi:hypothetical protein
MRLKIKEQCELNFVSRIIQEPLDTGNYTSCKTNEVNNLKITMGASATVRDKGLKRNIITKEQKAVCYKSSAL